ncbi:unnamed protein product, partial [Ectocarpus sp. 12 AP-2014]
MVRRNPGVCTSHNRHQFLRYLRPIASTKNQDIRPHPAPPAARCPSLDGAPAAPKTFASTPEPSSRLSHRTMALAIPRRRDHHPTLQCDSILPKDKSSEITIAKVHPSMMSWSGPPFQHLDSLSTFD